MRSLSLCRQRGVTLIESCLAATIAAISVGVVAPGFDRMAQRRHLEGTAAQLETDFGYLRSLSVARNQSLRISFTNTSAMSCYVIHTGSANACQCNAQGEPVCTGEALALRSVPFAAGGPVAVRSNSRSMLIDPRYGTVTPTGTMQVQDGKGETLKLVVNIMGRVRVCAATPDLPGYPRC